MAANLRRGDPARRPRRVLRVGRAARRPRAARAPGDRRRSRRPGRGRGRELRGARSFGVHSAMPMGRARRACPNGAFVSPRFDRYEELSREVMAILRVGHAARRAAVDRRGVPRRERRAAPPRHRHRDRAASCARACATKWDSSCRSASPPRSSSPSSRATSRNPTASSRSRRAPSGRSSRRCPSRACGASGPATLRRLERMAVRTIGELAALPGVGAHGRARRARSARACTRSRATTIRARSCPSARRSRSAPRRRSPSTSTSREACDHELVRIVDRVSGRLRSAGLRGAHGHAEDPLRELRDAHACAHAAGRDRREHGDPRDRARAARRARLRARCPAARRVALAARARPAARKACSPSTTAGADRQERSSAAPRWSTRSTRCATVSARARSARRRWSSDRRREARERRPA